MRRKGQAKKANAVIPAPDVTMEAFQRSTALHAQLADYVSVRQSALIVPLSEISLRRWMTKGKLTRFKLGSRTLISSSELMGLIRKA